MDICYCAVSRGRDFLISGFLTEMVDTQIFTFNRGNFFRLHTAWLRNDQHHAGIIVSDQLGTGVVMRRLLRLIDAKTADYDYMKDQFEFLSS